MLLKNTRRHGRLLVTLLVALLGVMIVLVASGRLTLPSSGRDLPARLAPGSPRVDASGASGAAGSGAPTGSGAPAGSALSGLSATEQQIQTFYAKVQADPEDLGSYLVLGYAYLQNVREKGDPADYGRAETAFNQVLQRDPESVSALVGKGALAAARHQFRDALDVANRSITLNDNVPEAYGLLGDAQTELGMYDEAVLTVQRMVDLRPDLSSYSRVSYQRELHGDIDGATAAMDAAYRAGGAPGTEGVEYVRVLLGNLQFAKGEVDEAEAIYDASLEASPGFVWALAGKARVEASRGSWDEAIELYQQAVDRIPLPEFVIALGETQEAAGRQEDAQETYALVRVIQQLFQANGVNTDLELALFEANHGGDAAHTVELARAAYADQPNIKAADALAWALFKAGQLDEARRYADEALHLGTRDGSYLFHAGMIANEQGDTAAAREYLTRAFDVNPLFSPLYGPVARQALDELASD